MGVGILVALLAAGCTALVRSAKMGSSAAPAEENFLLEAEGALYPILSFPKLNMSLTRIGKEVFLINDAGDRTSLGLLDMGDPGADYRAMENFDVKVIDMDDNGRPEFFLKCTDGKGYRRVDSLGQPGQAARTGITPD